MNKQFEIIDSEADGLGAVNTGISWATHTWNPLRYRLTKDYPIPGTGRVVPRGSWCHYCQRISAGCQRCYAAGIAVRFHGVDFTVPNREYIEPWIDEKEIAKALRLPTKGPFPAPHTRPAVFVGDMTDLWGDWVPFEMIDRVMAVAALRPDVTFQFLTKRAERMVEYFESRKVWDWGVSIGEGMKMIRFPLPNVILGFSAEDQPNFAARWAHMRKLAAMGWKVFASIEPQIGPVDAGYAISEEYLECLYCNEWHGYEAEENRSDTRDGEQTEDVWFRCPKCGEECAHTPLDERIVWAIVGGESGHGARPFNVQWMRDLIAQFGAAGVPLFCKQLGAFPTDDNWMRHTVNRKSGWPAHVWQKEGRIKLNDSHGGDWSEWPKDLRVRQLPEVA